LLSLILPVYNEARRIAVSLTTCAQYLGARETGAEIIVADDGSNDETREVFAAAVATLPQTGLTYRYLPLPHHGKGSAVCEGVNGATGDLIVFLDADLAIPVDMIDKFVRAIDEGADIAIASRYVPGSVVRRPRWRCLMSRVYRLCVRLLVPTGVQDTQCGGKAYTAAAAKDLFARQRLHGFAFDAEILFLARRAGYRVRELPFTFVQDHETSINLATQVPQMLCDLVRIRVNDVLGRYR
jgi:dolichyl-phosphate beta-glucosyltransferase